MTLELKRTLLASLYRVYDETTRQYPTACRAGCHACCTRNVLCTTLEADLIMHYFEEKNRSDLVERIMTTPRQQIQRPTMTLNTLAGYCLRREEPPEQHMDCPIAPCPLLEDGKCPAYEVRPFACRCLWSKEICAENGEACMDPVLVSLNGVFEQTIEHTDVGGLYGNFLDLLSVLASEQYRDGYRTGRPVQGTPHMLETESNPGFLVPPVHRPTVTRALNSLWEQRIGKLSFREVLRQIR